jgi:hypothetical protein
MLLSESQSFAVNGDYSQDIFDFVTGDAARFCRKQPDSVAPGVEVSLLHPAISVRQNQNPTVSTNFLENWSHN